MPKYSSRSNVRKHIADRIVLSRFGVKATYTRLNTAQQVYSPLPHMNILIYKQSKHLSNAFSTPESLSPVRISFRTHLLKLQVIQKANTHAYRSLSHSIRSPIKENKYWLCIHLHQPPDFQDLQNSTRHQSTRTQSTVSQ